MCWRLQHLFGSGSVQLPPATVGDNPAVHCVLMTTLHDSRLPPLLGPGRGRGRAFESHNYQEVISPQNTAPAFCPTCSLAQEWLIGQEALLTWWQVQKRLSTPDKKDLCPVLYNFLITLRPLFSFFLWVFQRKATEKKTWRSAAGSHRAASWEKTCLQLQIKWRQVTNS